MPRLFLVLVILLQAAHAYAKESNLNIYFHSHTFAYSETAPIKQIAFDDFIGPRFYGGKDSFTTNRWEAGVGFANMHVAAIARYDYQVRYSEDSAELIYADKNDKTLEDGRDYRLNLEVLHARTRGIKWGYTFDVVDEWHAGFAVSYLETRSYLDGFIRGNLSVNNNNYSGMFELDQVYSQDKLLDRLVTAEQGRGYALDLYARWQISAALLMELQGLDVLHRLKFDKAPFTRASASTNNVSLDAEGRIDVKPTLSGQEGFRSHTLQLPSQFQFDIEYALGAADFLLSLYRYDNLNFPSVGFKLTPIIGQELSLHHHFTENALSFDLGGENWRISLLSNRLEIHKATIFGLSFEIGVTF